MRIVQNSFVAGEIAPELYGRSDLQVYYHSASEIDNFIVKKTGGLVKRAGTELLCHLHVDGAIKYRVFSFFYDRTHYAIILFYIKQNDTTLFYRVLKPNSSIGPEQFTDVTTLGSADELDRFRIKQIGDTIFFSRRGAKAFSGKLDWDKQTINWESLQEEIAVTSAPELTLTPSDFKTETNQGYYATKREYALFGVKSGVLSEPSEKDTEIYLPWAAGAKVTIKFQPDWINHDSYQLALKQGSVYGVLSSFYPSTKSSKITDAAWEDLGFVAEPIIDGETFYANNPSEAWHIEPNLLEPTSADKSYHPSAVAVSTSEGSYLQCVHNKNNSPILSVKIWFGANLTNEARTEVKTIGTAGETNIQLLAYDDVSKEYTTIAEWENISASYTENGSLLEVGEPKASASGIYQIKMTNTQSDIVIVRGIILISDNEEQVFVDNNIAPGETTGIQESLHVGDSGMDVALVDIWEQRLVLASSNKLPFTLWFSSVGDIKNFYANRPQVSSDAFSVSIPAVTSTKILHMVTSRWFLLFTEGGEYSVDSVGNSGFGFDTITIRKTSNVGASESVEPVLTESMILFVSADGRKLYDMSYSLEQDVVKPSCRSDYVPHLTESDPIRKMICTQSPDPIIWCLTESGKLLSMTYLPENKIYAWARHNIGYDKLKLVDITTPTTLSIKHGELTTTDTILVFAHDDHPEDIYIERMRNNIATSTPTETQSQCYDHLGYAQNDYPDGVNPATAIVARIVTVPTQMGDSNTLGVEKNILDMCMHVRRSGQVKVRPFVRYGQTLAQAETLYQHKDLYPLPSDGEVPLYTGILKVLPRAFINPYGQVEIISDDGLPCEIMSVVCSINLGIDEQERR